ncbi:MAG: type II toxin-antitoxin system HicB family antitoxin [Nitriliruptor sp.]|uniref:type II toxin-antitoxin system HicB family antitoxin n=1 Tax=Nitriliruptor sp. TaxID=2448056 RepID=UPI00349FE149
MTVYDVHATWDDTGWWIVTVPDLGPSAVTQCRRLDQAERDVAEVIELLTGEMPGSYALTLSWDEVTAAATDARRLRAEAEQLADRARAATKVAVTELRHAGLSYRDIGTMTGISYQRAQQLVEG